MSELDRCVPFDDLGETPFHSEALVIDRRTCLFYNKMGGCSCGRCGRSVATESKPTVCENESCGQEWSCLIVTKNSPELTELWMPTYSESAVVSNSRELESRNRIRNYRYSARLGHSVLSL